MDYQQLDDAALMGLIAREQPEALSALYDRYGRLIFSLAYNIVGDQATAEEVAQDVFLRVWENAASYRVEQAKVTTWITSITRYRAIDVLRRRKARPALATFSWHEVEIQTAPNQDHNPEQAAELAIQQHRVRAALADLPAEQREALVLAYFGGMSQSQVAEALQQPLGTVKTRIRLAMQKLRHRFSDEDV